jgi:hypothetical protein
MVANVIDFDTDGEPAIALAAPGWTNQDAQAWVTENKVPMLVLDGGVQFVLVHPNISGSPVMVPFWGVTAQAKAIEAARRVLGSKTEG